MDRALLGHHAGGLAVIGENPCDGEVFNDPGALGIGHGNVGRVHLPVLRKPEAADDTLGIDRGPAFLDLDRADRLDRKAEIATHRSAARQLFVTRRIGRHAQRARPTKAGGLAGLLFETAEQLASVLRQFGHLARNWAQGPSRAMWCHWSVACARTGRRRRCQVW